jgi:hypothetical protein
VDEGDAPQEEPELELEDETRRYVADLEEQPEAVAEIDQARQAAIDAVRGGDCVSVSWLREPNADEAGEAGATHWLISPLELAPSLILFVMAKAWVDFKELTGADDHDVALALRRALQEGVGQ